MQKRAKSSRKKATQPQPKQLVSECLDLLSDILREAVRVYSREAKQECGFKIDSADPTILISYMLDPCRYEAVVAHFEKDPEEQRSKRQFLRSWMYEMKAVRNAWAHWPVHRMDYRLASRAYDTLALLYLGLNGNTQNPLYAQLEVARKRTLLASIREGELKAKNS